MANLFRKARAEPVVRACAEDENLPDPYWTERVQRLSEVIEYRVSATCIAMLGTAMLAKALHHRVNLYWFKPTHVDAIVRIFARRCQTEAVRVCGVLMVSQRQPQLDEVALRAWADGIGVNLQLWTGWERFTREALFWSKEDASDAAATAAMRVRTRLVEAEVSNNVIENWDALTCRDT